jgi:hypothetical protein
MRSPVRELPPALIELKLADLAQLFNSMDPSPFHERDLDRDAEEFILSWAREHPKAQPFKLVIHLANPTGSKERDGGVVESSIQHYFEYRAQMRWRDFKRLMREGRVSLMIGLGFLLLCQGVALLVPVEGAPWWSVIHQGLTIAGWVAMWWPMEIYLYRWWPLLAERKLLRRLARMEVEIV